MVHPLVMLKKKTMIQNRIQKSSNIEKRLISEDRKQQTLLVKKTATLKNEIKHLSNDATDIDGSENFIREGSPQNTTPVKMSSLLPNKELKREARKTDAKFSHQTSEVLAMNARDSMKKSIISEQADEKLSMDGYRMNLFEKMEVLNGKSRTSLPTGLARELTNSPVGELRKSRTSHTKHVSSVSEGPSKDIAECNASVFSVVYCGDTQQSKDRQTLDNSSGDFSDRITGEKFEHSSSDKVKFNAFYPELPNSWSSAYISESQIGNKIQASRGELKRKQVDIHAFNVESLKRRCKTLPRKVVRKDVLDMNFDVTSCLDDLPMSERKECGYNQECLPPEIGETKERDEIIVDCSDVNLLIKPGCEVNTPKVYDDEILQRNMELRESKISDLLRKQRGLLQSLEKKATNMMKSAW